MQTLTVKVKNNSGIQALRELEEKHLIKIVSSDILKSPSLPGSELSLKEFEDWVLNAESEQSISLQQAKAQWASKKEKLRQSVK